MRSELETLRLKELRARAKAEGAEPEQLEEAADADDPKQAVIDLLLGLHATTVDTRVSGPTKLPLRTGNTRAHETALRTGALRAELEGLRLKELRQRAREQDVSPEEMEEAADSDEPKAAMVELLLRKAEA